MKKLSMRVKLVAGLCTIAAVLLVSSLISIFEYARVSSYVSTRIADNINNVNAAREMSDAAAYYNLDVLAVIGDDSRSEIPYFDSRVFMARCDSLSLALSSTRYRPLADSVKYAFSAYMLTSFELPQVLEDDYRNSRDWYFERLQPRYNRLQGYIGKMSSAVHEELESNSTDFDSGFYRSSVPGMIAAGVGLLLILMLLCFILADYVNPLYRMLDGLKSFRQYNRKYSCEVDSNDEMEELNSEIGGVVAENQQLRKRIAELKRKNKAENEE